MRQTRAGSSLTNRAAQRGHTLVETMIALVLMSLLVLATMTLFIKTTSIVAQNLGETDAAAKGANGLQSVMNSFHEASVAALPGESGFTPDASYAGASFTTTSAGQTIDTAVLLTYPAASTTVSVYYQGRTQLVSPAPYDRTLTNTSSLLIYRGDFGVSGVTDGTPDAAGGQYLCQSSGGVQNAVKVCKLSDTASVAAATPNAVSFARIGTSQIEVRLIVNNYSPNVSQASSESTQTLLTGKCVLLRNHS